MITVPDSQKKRILLVQFKHARTDRCEFFCAQCCHHSSELPNGYIILAPEPRTGDRFRSWNNSIEITVDREERTAKFGPRGNIKLDGELRSLGIGSYLMAQVILWAQQRYPDFSVTPGDLSPVDAGTPEAQARRNGFYAKHGFDFVWKDAEHTTGQFYKDRLDQLHGCWHEDKVREFSVDELVAKQASQWEQISALARENSFLESGLKRADRKNRQYYISCVWLALIMIGLIIFPQIPAVLNHWILRLIIRAF
ncbi:MAG TPA: hypothetical protein VFK06_25160 [Candidatus Angelobacter sp.]|nr:hypothetical protein [Candidatus Angelobacter sp.]